MTKTKFTSPALLMMVTLLALGAGLAYIAIGQEPAEIQGLDPNLPATPATPSEGDNAPQKVTLWALIQAGGWAMWPLATFSVLIVTLAMLQFTSLRKDAFCPDSLAGEIKRHLACHQLEQAITAAAASRSYFGRMMSRCLPYVDLSDGKTLGRAHVHEAMAEFTTRANQTYMNRIHNFSILAQASPMLGLLGTVSGMIKAFGSMGREGMGDPTRLSGHISEALVTTAFGLIIALPALFCYFGFRNRLVQLVGECVDAADNALDSGSTRLRTKPHEDAE